MLLIGLTGSIGMGKSTVAQWLLVNPGDFKKLEQIVHPLVFAAEQALLRAEAEKGAPMAVLEIPLLFETGGEKRVDVTMVVSAPAHLQRERVLARPGMTVEKLEQILAKQVPDAEKRARAEFVVDTGLALPETQAQVDKVIESLKGRTGTAYAHYWA